MANPDGAAKLQQLVGAEVAKYASEIKEHVTARSQDLQIQVGQLEVQMRALAQAFAEGSASKAKPRAKKAAAEPAGAAAPTDNIAANAANAADVAEAPAEAVPGKRFAANSYNWFTAKFKSDANFRAKHLTEANLELMKNEEAIAKKKTDAEKIAPQAKFLWSYYKIKDVAMHKELTAQYEAEKEAHDKTGKPVQQVKEENSPTTDRK